MPFFGGISVEIVPEKSEVDTTVIKAPVAPALGELARRGAKVQRPDLLIEGGVPQAQVLADHGIRNSRFFA